MDKEFDVVIIGGGPAGLTAAIYASRANLRTILFEGSKDIGGQLVLTTEVENYPGFPEGILGPELMKKMREQAKKFGSQILSEDVTRADFSRKPYSVETGKSKIKAKSVIIATGARTRWLGLESEKKLIGRGISSCATCDGAFYKNKDIFVIGGGDSAMEEALFLTRFAKSITVVHRRDKLKASKIMQDRAFKNNKIKFAWDSEVSEILGKERVSGIKIKNIKTKKVTELKGEGVFIAIGHIPNSEIFKDLEKDKNGYLVVKNSIFTSKPGVFVSGDVQDHIYKQAITAAGLGCMAAIEAEKYLEINK